MTKLNLLSLEEIYQSSQAQEHTQKQPLQDIMKHLQPETQPLSSIRELLLFAKCLYHTIPHPYHQVYQYFHQAFMRERNWQEDLESYQLAVGSCYACGQNSLAMEILQAGKQYCNTKNQVAFASMECLLLYELAGKNRVQQYQILFENILRSQTDFYNQITQETTRDSQIQLIQLYLTDTLQGRWYNRIYELLPPESSKAHKLLQKLLERIVVQSTVLIDRLQTLDVSVLEPTSSLNRLLTVVSPYYTKFLPSK